MKVTNISRALQGVNGMSGRVFIRPGECKDIEFDEASLKLALRLKDLLSIEMGDPDAGKASGEERTPAEVLALADGNFMTFKSAAKKLLGDAIPDKKDEIIAALNAL